MANEPTPLNATLTPRKAAEQELAAEKRQKAIAAMKIKLRELDAAKLVVSNIERDVADYEKQIADGDIPSA